MILTTDSVSYWIEVRFTLVVHSGDWGALYRFLLARALARHRRDTQAVVGPRKNNQQLNY